MQGFHVEVIPRPCGLVRLVFRSEDGSVVHDIFEGTPLQMLGQAAHQFKERLVPAKANVA